MAKSSSNRSGGNRGGKDVNQASGKGKGAAGGPSKTGNRSGKGRDNVPSKKSK